MSDAIDSLAVVFPGQGSQYVGMAARLCAGSQEARARFDEASQLVSIDILKHCTEGPADQLQQTRVAQLAMFVTDVAVWEAVAGQIRRPVAVAGHSLGEYAALVAAGVLPFSQALGLVELRSRLMQRSAEEHAGGMLAVIGLADERVEEICAAARRERPDCMCVVANYNCPGQVVVSTDRSFLEDLQARLKQGGARLVKPLKVSGAFHCPAMQHASEGVAEALDGADLRNADTPLVSNADAKMRSDAASIREALKLQMCSPVRWAASVRNMETACGVKAWLELGPGKVLAGLIKRTIAEACTTSLETPDDLPEWCREPAK